MSDWMLKRGIPIAIVCLIAGVVFGLIAISRQEMACQRHGYPEAKVWPSVTYCVKRVEQTDVVVRLDSLEATP